MLALEYIINFFIISSIYLASKAEFLLMCCRYAKFERRQFGRRCKAIAVCPLLYAPYKGQSFAKQSEEFAEGSHSKHLLIPPLLPTSLPASAISFLHSMFKSIASLSPYLLIRYSSILLLICGRKMFIYVILFSILVQRRIYMNFIN